MMVTPPLDESIDLVEVLQDRPDLQLHAAIYRWAASRFETGWVIDLGSELGIGMTLMAQVNNQVKYIGMDSNLQIIKQASDIGLTKTRTIQADGASLPIKSNVSSGVSMVNMLHLVEDPEAVLFEVRRILKPGGAVIISIPLEKLMDRWKPATITKHLRQQAIGLFRNVHFYDKLTNPVTGLEWDDLSRQGILLCVAEK